MADESPRVLFIEDDVGKRYVIAVRTGPTTRRLGTAVKRTVRIR